MGLGTWLKNQAIGLAIAVSKVEQNALGQKGNNLENTDGTHQGINQGRLSDDLLKGQLTQQVKELRWRTYKILMEAENWSTKGNPIYKDGISKAEPIYNDEGEITGYHEPEIIGYEPVAKKIDDDYRLLAIKNIKVDDYDDYEVEMVIPNNKTVLGRNQIGLSDKMEYLDEAIEDENEYGEKTTTHAVIKAEDLENASNEVSDDDKPIFIERDFRPRIEMERFVKKLVVRKIDEETKLLEFYISKYPDEFDKRTALVIAESKKILENGRRSDMIDIQKVGFITNKAIGVKDFLEYQYDIVRFDKVVDYDGNFVFKFIAKMTVHGENIAMKYLEEGLEEKYENKEARDKKKD